MDKRDIVVVDDQPSICKEIVAFLKDDYMVHAFLTGKDALAYMSEHPADLVILDYEMPNMTGYEVMMAIRLNQSIGNTPVIFLTSWTKERMRQEMMGRGATDFLCKPVTKAELRECVKNNLLN